MEPAETPALAVVQGQRVIQGLQVMWGQPGRPLAGFPKHLLVVLAVMAVPLVTEAPLVLEVLLALAALVAQAVPEGVGVLARPKVGIAFIGRLLSPGAPRVVLPRRPEMHVHQTVLLMLPEATVVVRA